MSNKLPLISIITPSFNQGDFIEETIKSIVNQSYPNIEYVIIDGGSNDQTLEIIKKYKKNISYWHSKSDKGQSNAINIGLDKIKGDIIAFLNSDDCYFDSLFMRIADLFFKYPEYDLIYGKSLFINAEGQELGQYKSYQFILKDVLLKGLNPIPQPSVFMTRKLIKSIGYFNEDLNFAFDWEYWIRAKMRFRFKYIPEIFSKYRLHQDSKSISKPKLLAKDVHLIYNSVMDNPYLPKLFEDKKNQLLARASSMSFNAFCSAGDYKNSKIEFKKLFKYSVFKSISFKQWVKLLLIIIGKPGRTLLTNHYSKLAKNNINA